MKETIKIGNKKVGKDSPCFIVAEMSGNHNMDVTMIREAKKSRSRCS